jgi:hypothetical protein
MQHVNTFGAVLPNEEQNEHTLFPFSNILRTVSLLIPAIPSNILTLRVRSPAKHFSKTSVDSSVLEVEGRPFC